MTACHHIEIWEIDVRVWWMRRISRTHLMRSHERDKYWNAIQAFRFVVGFGIWSHNERVFVHFYVERGAIGQVISVRGSSRLSTLLFLSLSFYSILFHITSSFHIVSTSVNKAFAKTCGRWNASFILYRRLIWNFTVLKLYAHYSMLIWFNGISHIENIHSYECIYFVFRFLVCGTQFIQREVIFWEKLTSINIVDKLYYFLRLKYSVSIIKTFYFCN